MAEKRLAMNTEGQLTWCTADEEHIGKGRCNHIAHQGATEDPQVFLERANAILKNKESLEKRNLDLESFNSLSLRKKTKLAEELHESGNIDEVKELCNSYPSVACEMIRKGHNEYYDSFKDTENNFIKKELVEQGVFLDKFKDDEDVAIRTAARIKLGIEQEVSENYTVRDAKDESFVYKNGKYLFTTKTYDPANLDSLSVISKSEDCSDADVELFQKRINQHLYANVLLNNEDENLFRNDYDQNYLADNINEKNFVNKLGLDEVLCQPMGGWNGTGSVLEGENKVIENSSIKYEVLPSGESDSLTKEELEHSKVFN